MQLAAETKLIEVNTVFEPGVGQIMGDSTRMQQVVWNLLSNAIKFTPRGGKVEVRLQETDGYAQIIVSDTGKGISADFLPFVFDYFRQADSTSTRNFGGLGLGLAIVRNIIEMHGGIVKADSHGEDKGSIFTVSLPLLADESPRLTDEKNYPTFLASKSLPLNDMRILVVDDDTDSRDFVAFVLEQDGAFVMTVSSAEEALQALAEVKLDVLVSDISMPDMDGYMLIHQVRTRTPEQGGQIPAIALTAFARNNDQEKALNAGFQMHLSKPLNPEKLIAAIVKLMETKVSAIT